MEEKTNAAGVGMKRIGNGLYLPSLVIENFRGFKKLAMPELGQVTLLAGENCVGKSTVLEAVQLYAGAGSYRVMRRMLRERENVRETDGTDDDGAATVSRQERSLADHHNLDFASLFCGFGESETGSEMEIGPADRERTLKIRLSNLDSAELEDVPPWMWEGEEFKCLKVSLGGREIGGIPFAGAGAVLHRGVPGSFGWDAELAKEFTIDCVLAGPGLPSNADMVPRYENLLATAGAERVLHVLQSANKEIEALHSRGDGRRRGFPRRMIVKRKGVEGQIPLRSLGEGVVRLFGMAVTLIGAKRGLLLFDNMDHGLHHSIIPKVWELVFDIAKSRSVQIIATTHSWDCVKGFAKAAKDQSEEVKGALVRIDREGDNTWAVPYSVEELPAAVRGGIEVR